MNDPRLFARADDERDGRFYASPRFVEHIDARAIAALEALYRERLPAGVDVLDLMSSWVSHLPADVAFASVTGLGMNDAELRRNPALARSVVHDLNADPVLPFADASFGAATIAVSIQYLTQPVAVMRELARVTRPGAPLVISFSNRCFPTKAVAIWRMTDDPTHLQIVGRYVTAAGGWTQVETRAIDTGGDPLYAVLATRA